MGFCRKLLLKQLVDYGFFNEAFLEFHCKDDKHLDAVPWAMICSKLLKHIILLEEGRGK